MDIRTNPGSRFTEVVLSKRNLDTLVGLYEMYEQGEALPVISRGFLRVRVEPDEIHYKDRDAGSDPVIEAALARGPEITD